MNVKTKLRNSKIPMPLKILFFLLFTLILIITITAMTLKPKTLSVSNVDLSAIEDGSYTGSADNGLVKASVSVDINHGAIQNITVLEHDNLLGKPAEKITDDIINAQSLEVDAVTSATYSSNTILKAVENALIHPAKEE